MRILHIYKDYYPVVGGIENHIKMLAERQAAAGHAVTVLVTSRDRRTHMETLAGVRVLFAGRLATISSAPLSAALFDLLRRETPDVAHLHFPYPLGEVAQWLVGRAPKTVLTYHSDIVRQKYLRVLYGPFMHRVLARVDRIIATSPNYIDTSPVLSRWRARCTVVPLGIETAPFEAAPLVSGAGVREGEGLQLLFVGKLRYYKGLNDLLAALQQLPRARLSVVGSGPMEAEWKRLAASLGVADRVTFIGEVENAALPGWYAACDVFVLPACERSEAFGAVQLEAMASGKPVVSTDVGTGVGWVNQDSVTGYVVPPHDPAALASAIYKLGDPARRAQMGAAGRARVRNEFTIETMVERVMQVYVGGSSFRTG